MYLGENNKGITSNKDSDESHAEVVYHLKNGLVVVPAPIQLMFGCILITCFMVKYFSLIASVLSGLF